MFDEPSSRKAEIRGKMRSEEPVLADGSPEMFVLFDGYLNFTGRDPNLRARGSRVNEVVVRVMEYVYN